MRTDYQELLIKVRIVDQLLEFNHHCLDLMNNGIFWDWQRQKHFVTVSQTIHIALRARKLVKQVMSLQISYSDNLGK